MNSIEIPIKEFIALDKMMAIEDALKKEGVIPDHQSILDAEIVESKKAFELYELKKANMIAGYPCTHKEENQVYSMFREASQGVDEQLKNIMCHTIYSLFVAAINTKLEGHIIGSGKIIIQNRLGVYIVDGDWNDYGYDHITIRWYGSIFRIGDEYEVR